MLKDKAPGQRLRAARKAAGLSAIQLAEILGLAPSAVRNHENGTNGFSARFKQYADALGVSEAWLAFGDGVREPSRKAASGVQLTQLPSGKARLEINTVLPFDVALEILAKLQGVEK